MHLGFPPLLAQFSTSQEANWARYPERTMSHENGQIHTNNDVERFLRGAEFLSHYPTSGVPLPMLGSAHTISLLFWQQPEDSEAGENMHPRN